ncbi:MAG: leucine-rich repeat domain-containing protein [Ruminococcaceae bacterium]|nr:leucine-rich repeat domain-containing protein [Oscillospiraceae bacterium]
MKYFRLLTYCFIICTLLAFSACESAEPPDAPRDIAVEYETLTLKWSEVKGAKIYTVRIEQQNKEPILVDLSKTYYSLESLPAGEYSVSVRACGQRTEYSPFSNPVDFIRDEECGLVFKLIDGKGEYEVASKGEATGVIEIPSIYRQKAVTAIGEKAFFNAGDITEVKLPDSIKSIGSFAFANCSYLEKINLPQGILSLGESVFSGCRALGGTLSLPEGLVEIPKSAFAYCSSIEEIHFGQKLVSIGDNAFTDLSNLKAIILPKSLKKIGNFAFAACADATEIRFEEGLLEIGEFAFSKAISINSLILPNSLKTIGMGAFYHSSNLSSVTLGSEITEMGDSAFLETAIYNNSPTNEIYMGNWFLALKDTTVSSINIREGTEGIANSALYANQSITAIELPNSVKYIGKNAFAGSNILSIVTGSGILHISDQAFLFCNKLIDVVLGSYDYVEQTLKESSLQSIGNYAFMNCSKLARIQIPETVKEIGSYAFRNTELFHNALTGAVYADNWIVDYNDTVTENIVVDKGTVGIARYAFYNLQELKSIKIDNSVKYIGKGAFYNCTALQKVTFPDALERIEDYTFYNCSSLKLTSLPPMLREIGRSAFYMCGVTNNDPNDTDSDRLEIPAGVTYIGDFAFFGCGYRRADSISGETETSGIDMLVIGDRVEYIGKCAFRDFASLKSVIIGGTLMIGDKAFYDCSSLEEITVKNKLVTIGDKAFYRCTGLKTAMFPDTLKTIGNYSFYKCEALTAAFVGNGLEKIGNFAFLGDILLSNLQIPTTVLSIGEQAFRDCGSLPSLALGKNLLFIGAHAFYSCHQLTLYVDTDATVSEWHTNWNSSFAVAVLGCKISDDGYVTSVMALQGSVMNKFTDTELSAPSRNGYNFIGWSTSESAEEVQHPAEYVCDPNRKTALYSVWEVIQ